MKKIIFGLLLFIGLFSLGGTVQAADKWCLSNLEKVCKNIGSGACVNGKEFLNEADCNKEIQTKTTPTQGNVVKLINPLGGTEADPQGQMNLPILLGTIIKNFLGILGAVALLVFVYAGFEWVTAAGNSDKVSAGANAMLWSAIGICIIFSSYAILKLIFDAVLGPGAFDGSNKNQPTVPACYCTVNGTPNVAMTDPADGFTGPTAEAAQTACLKIQTKVTLPKSGKTIADCKWH